MLAEAKSLTGGDPTAEINLIRARAYKANYDVATMGYPNMAGDKDGINEVLLRERYKEFMFEGKRWYDLRRFGDDMYLSILLQMILTLNVCCGQSTRIHYK